MFGIQVCATSFEVMHCLTLAKNEGLGRRNLYVR
jgi:hypothetical protein